MTRDLSSPVPAHQHAEPERSTTGDWLRWRLRTLAERAAESVRTPVLAGVLLTLAVLGGIVAFSLFRGGSLPANAAVTETENDQLGAPAAPTALSREPNPEATGTELWVHVLGEVERPGVYRLAEGERVFDALEAAGGAAAGAALEAINLARALTDGEQLRVPDAAEAAAWADTGTPDTEPPIPQPAGSPPGSDTVNLNTATLAELQTLPRVGPALAERILAFVTDTGGFTTVEELILVSGIGERTLEGLRELVRV